MRPAAPRPGFEPGAYSLGGSRSIGLSYRGGCSKDNVVTGFGREGHSARGCPISFIRPEPARRRDRRRGRARGARPPATPCPGRPGLPRRRRRADRHRQRAPRARSRRPGRQAPWCSPRSWRRPSRPTSGRRVTARAARRSPTRGRAGSVTTPRRRPWQATCGSSSGGSRRAAARTGRGWRRRDSLTCRWVSPQGSGAPRSTFPRRFGGQRAGRAFWAPPGRDSTEHSSIAPSGDA